MRGRPKGYSPGPRREVDSTSGEWTWSHERLQAKIQTADDASCWNWTGARGPQGNLFGAYKNGQQQMTQANRLIYARHTNTDITGKHVFMTCRNKHCCNYNHMTTLAQPKRGPQTITLVIGFHEQQALTAEQNLQAKLLLKTAEVIDQGIDHEFEYKWFKVTKKSWFLAQLTDPESASKFTIRK